MALALRGLGVTCHRAGLVLNGRQVLQPLNLEIPAGSRVVLLGANGAGKTQLLKLLGGERWPTPTPEGDEDRRYSAADGTQVDTTDALPKIVFIGGERQDKYYRYDWNFTVQRVVSTGVHNVIRPVNRLSPAERSRVRGLLTRFKLRALARRHFLTLSYGERRRVLIARALAGQPDLVLLDEVHNGLDRSTRALLDRELGRLMARGVTLVMAAHRQDDVPAGFDRALVLESGRVSYDGALARAPQRWLSTVDQPTQTVTASTPPPTDPLLTLRDAYVYRDYRAVITGLNWTVRAGEHWAIVGANGSGKSTLLQAIYGLLPFAARGEVRRRGYAIGTHIEEWRRRIGFVSPELQSEYLDDLSVLDFVVSGERMSFGLLIPATAPERRRARVALKRVGLLVDPQSSIRVLSYGQRRLALFARALVLQPEALLLDEPLTGLDAPYRAHVRAMLSDLARSSVQLLAAVHHASDLVPEFEHVLEIRRGKGKMKTRLPKGI